MVPRPYSKWRISKETKEVEWSEGSSVSTQPDRTATSETIDRKSMKIRMVPAPVGEGVFVVRSRWRGRRPFREADPSTRTTRRWICALLFPFRSWPEVDFGA